MTYLMAADKKHNPEKDERAEQQKKKRPESDQ